MMATSTNNTNENDTEMIPARQVSQTDKSDPMEQDSKLQFGTMMHQYADDKYSKKNHSLRAEISELESMKAKWQKTKQSLEADYALTLRCKRHFVVENQKLELSLTASTLAQQKQYTEAKSQFQAAQDAIDMMNKDSTGLEVAIQENSEKLKMYQDSIQDLKELKSQYNEVLVGLQDKAKHLKQLFDEKKWPELRQYVELYKIDPKYLGRD